MPPTFLPLFLSLSLSLSLIHILSLLSFFHAHIHTHCYFSPLFLSPCLSSTHLDPTYRYYCRLLSLVHTFSLIPVCHFLSRTQTLFYFITHCLSCLSINLSIYLTNMNSCLLSIAHFHTNSLSLSLSYTYSLSLSLSFIFSQILFPTCLFLFLTHPKHTLFSFTLTSLSHTQSFSHSILSLSLTHRFTLPIYSPSTESIMRISF
ncbi:unnamed protein product [Acanthosepion pharaonis]|uniref:Uncharacterized protein n=1 Tax=Acanthosepion pharaonis TaxID=158019 RepID=A0A812CYK8_ACAPH|nr:unnamed protein product [Sepia pharaonis]